MTTTTKPNPFAEPAAAKAARDEDRPRAVTLHDRAHSIAILTEWEHEHYDVILANDGALPDELAALLDDAEVEFTQKVTAVRAKIEELDASADAAKATKDRLAQREKVFRNAAKGLKRYLEACLTTAGRDRIDTPLGVVAMQTNPPSLTFSLTYAEYVERFGKDGERAPEWLRVVPPSEPTVEVANRKEAIAAWDDALPDVWVRAHNEVELTDDEVTAETEYVDFLAAQYTAEQDGEVSDEDRQQMLVERLDALLTSKKEAFVRKVMATVCPGVEVTRGRSVRLR